MTALTDRERKDVGDEINTLERHGGEEAKMNLIYGWVKSGKITRRQHGLLCRMVLTRPDPGACCLGCPTETPHHRGHQRRRGSFPHGTRRPS